MAEHHLVGVFVHLSESDKAAALLYDVISRNLKALRIGENAGVLFLGQNALFAPGSEVLCGARINAFTLFGVKQLRQSEDYTDQVVGAALVIGLLHGRRNLVIGLRDDVFEADSRWVVPPGAKGINAGHEEGLAPS